jgi:hypothetical protein
MDRDEMIEIFKTYKKTEPQSNININEILKSIDSNSSFENNSIEKVTRDIFESLDEITINDESKRRYCEKLVGYRYIDEIKDIQTGRIVSWIHRRKPPRLVCGAIVMNIKFTDLGIYIICKFLSNYGNMVQIKFDDMLIYQKMTPDEELILATNSYLQK